MLNLSHCRNYFNTIAASLAHTTKLKDKRLKVLLISLVFGKYLGSNTEEQILVVFKNKCDFFFITPLPASPPADDNSKYTSMPLLGHLVQYIM